ncbi:TRAP transporter, DctM subunit [Lutimaribacter pacificus]|uniref:TRAP transporter, DctM subunit n=1 Tax=Lutimaribacter pacificus TaxID=391948 RepID=A0A1H0EMZ9_9RHOB|nr:TRAP transporter large permease subunit [Lutimaribacter pacificus]SDN83827.1 TRAP transporter, DctM subunit [Lutimaribacter pacificus]SHK50983.1 TRAP transporter, DctM subunit [Lutimaribacter pacificus]
MPEAISLSIVIGWFLFFLLIGQHVATVLFGAGIVGVLLWVGPPVLNGIVGQDVFFTVSNYSLSIIPLYLLMAQLLMRGGLVLDLFRVGHRLAGYRRFPLGVATLIIGGLLGAVSGSGAASAASLATLAGPELERVGYSRRFSLGLAAVAGSLSAVIPPSLIVIIYGSITSVPIGKLFIGLLGPGVLCMIVYIVCLAIFAEDGDMPEPEKAAADEDERGAVAASVFLIGLLVVVFGGIYGGIITVGEAGAIGAFTAMVGLFAMRRIGLRELAHSLADSAKISAMLLLLVIGAQIFARFLAFSRVPRELLALAEPFIDQPGLLIAALMVVLFLAGMILESAAVILLIVPIVLPILEAAGVDLLWFGVLASLMIALGLLTPPVGLSAYAAAAAQGYSVAEIFRPATKFALVAAIVVVGATILFPGIVTFLPSHLD